jgi:hypothetical protein
MGGEPRDVVVRLYRPGDEAGIADLLQGTFGVWPKVDTSVSANEHIRWKLSSDVDSRRFQVVAEAGGEVVGCRLFFLSWFRVRGERLRCRQGFDLAVQSNYQGRGVLNDMWSFARHHFDDKNDFNFGVGDHPAALHMRVAQGNIVIQNKVQVLSRDLSAFSGTSSNQIDVLEVDCFDEQTNMLFESCVPAFDFIRERSSRYLNWRFADKRAGRFTKLAAIEAHQLLGYVVLTKAQHVGVVADMLVLPGRQDVLGALLQAALRRFVEAGCLSADCWTPTVHPDRSSLIQHGFSRKKRGIHLSYRYLRAPPTKLEFLSNHQASVHIMAADTDLV